MKFPLKATLITSAVAIVLLLAALLFVLTNQSSAVDAETPGGQASEVPDVVRPNSHVLDDAGEGSVTVVEFLDFECEACGAFYPIVEDLRKQYAGDLTYVVRYFPLPGHANSKNAAIAAEAAAQQGQFEAMYNLLFQTQTEWGEAGQSRPEVFRGFAEELGLDMAAYDAAVADPATAERVEFDVNEGKALGVSSTPTFFVNGELLQLQKWDDLETAIESAKTGGR